MPVLVDMEERGYNIDPNQIEDAITSRTRAIMPVHLYGQPCDLDAVLEIARRRGLKVIEDACQAHGARYKGRRAGTIGDVGCFSFYPGKNLGAYGDGGAVVTADGELAEKMTRLRNYGQQKKYYHSEKGLNARLDTMQAAVLGVKLKYLDEWNRRRAAHAARYKELLKVVEQVALPETLPDRDHIFHLFVIRVQERDRLQQYLAEKGVSALIHYPIPIHLQEAYTELGYTERAFPATERAAREILSLPMYSELRPEQIERVSSAVTDFFYRQS
jgi:dTDP-4-amino-4,6-dideoxygalactose transaminase